LDNKSILKLNFEKFVMDKNKNNKNKLLLEEESTQKSYYSAKQASLPITLKPLQNERVCKNNPNL